MKQMRTVLGGWTVEPRALTGVFRVQSLFYFSLLTRQTDRVVPSCPRLAWSRILVSRSRVSGIGWVGTQKPLRRWQLGVEDVYVFKDFLYSTPVEAGALIDNGAYQPRSNSGWQK